MFIGVKTREYDICTVFVHVIVKLIKENTVLSCGAKQWSRNTGEWAPLVGVEPGTTVRSNPGS
jgi:hypothetical protein